MRRDTHYVVPTPDGKWAIRRSGGKMASTILTTRREAIKSARITSRNQKTKLVICIKSYKLKR